MSQYHTILDIASDVVAVVAYKVKRNPVLVGAAALWVAETAAAQDVLTWQGVITLAVGFLVRSKTVPANEVTDLSEAVQDVIGDIFYDAEKAAQAGLPEAGEGPTLF